MSQHRVCRVADFPESGRLIAEVGGRSIGIFRNGSQFYAVLNLCPHQFAPLCEGRLTGTNRPGAVAEYEWCREGEILRCPWHAWEFDITTGKSVFDPETVRTKIFRVDVQQDLPDAVETFPVRVAEDAIFVEIPGRAKAVGA